MSAPPKQSDHIISNSAEDSDLDNMTIPDDFIGASENSNSNSNSSVSFNFDEVLDEDDVED